MQQEGELLQALFSKYSTKDLLSAVLTHLQQAEGLSLSSFIELASKATQEITIPLAIFRYNLNPQEALVKYLRENCHQTNKEIAKKLGKDSRSVWASYSKSRKKHPKAFKLNYDENNYSIPLATIAKNKLSLLETITHYLTTTQHLTSKEIAMLLDTSQNSVAVLKKRARDKL